MIGSLDKILWVRVCDFVLVDCCLCVCLCAHNYPCAYMCMCGSIYVCACVYVSSVSDENSDTTARIETMYTTQEDKTTSKLGKTDNSKKQTKNK